jgi:uncharacterized Zn finger protein (UPF0148 family)
MSTDQVVWTCPVCGGERTSAVRHGEIYCGDCNRIHLVAEADRAAAEDGTAAAETVQKVA